MYNRKEEVCFKSKFERIFYIEILPVAEYYRDPFSPVTRETNYLYVNSAPLIRKKKKKKALNYIIFSF